MPIVIEGVKYSLKELKGTDTHAVHTFCRKNKSKACYMIYVDENNEIQHTGVWYTKKHKKILDDFLIKNYKLK